MTNENTTAASIIDESTIGQEEAKQATDIENDDSKIKALPDDQLQKKSNEDVDKGTNDTIDHETSLVVTEDDTAKPDIAMTDATSNNSQGIGDVELIANFPQKLTEILSNEEYKDIVHWLPHGKGFIVANKKRFADEVLPKYFKKAKFTSFTRKLNRWNFVRITRGPEVGSYYHPNFQRDNIKLVAQMTCIGSKQPQAIKPLDPIALGVLPMGEAIETAAEKLGGIQQWQRQDHERYRLFYQQNHWNYMMQMMQKASAQQGEVTEAGTNDAAAETVAATAGTGSVEAVNVVKEEESTTPMDNATTNEDKEPTSQTVQGEIASMKPEAEEL